MQNRRHFIFLWVLSILFLIFTGTTAAGVMYTDPFGGWTYTYNGDAAAAGSSGFDSLDGTWSHDNGSDQWDGTAIGAGKPGGASALTENSTTDYLRLQDTGDPRDYGFGGDPSNRKLFFLHNMANDDAAANPILDNGITLSFRTKLSTDAPLDDAHPDGGGPTSAWPTGGDGYTIHDGGKGNFGVEQSDGGTISFSLAANSDIGDLTQDERDALIFNNLNGNIISGGVDTGDPGALNAFFLDDATDWHEFWITIQEDTTNVGTHMVEIFADGSLEPYVFYVTAGNGWDAPFDTASFLTMGLGSTPQLGAIDIDFYSFKTGIHSPNAPIPEPATMILLGTGLIGLAGIGGRNFSRKINSFPTH
jgi:hypothetical protein